MGTRKNLRYDAGTQACYTVFCFVLNFPFVLLYSGMRSFMTWTTYSSE